MKPFYKTGNQIKTQLLCLTNKAALFCKQSISKYTPSGPALHDKCPALNVIDHKVLLAWQRFVVEGGDRL